MIQTDPIPNQDGRQWHFKALRDFRKRVSLADNIYSCLPLNAVFCNQFLEPDCKSVRATLRQIHKETAWPQAGRDQIMHRHTSAR